MGSFGFARRYSQNRSFFLFLRLLRCFSSPGSLRYTMDSCNGTWSLSRWVSPFRYLWIKAYLQLPTAFRSLSRLSSALSAKASSLRSFFPDHFHLSMSEHIALCSGRLNYVFLFKFMTISRHASDVSIYLCALQFFRIIVSRLDLFSIRFSRYKLSSFA